MSVDFQVFTDESQARKALVSFLEPGCAERWFVFDSPDPNPVNNCLCWHDYRNLKGAVSASIRFSLLDLSYHQPFSGIKRLLFNFFGAKIHKSVYISPKVIIDTLFPSLLTIQQGVLLGVRAGIALHDHSGRRFRLGRVVIKAGATIGSDAVIGPGVEIGEHAIVGMGAVVLRDVPPGALVLGNPARVVNRIGGEM